jgi:hypothetical protein
MSERRFTEEEAAEILKQAVEIQDSGTSLTAPPSGLTLAELQEIGREVGVSPEVIQLAARRIDPMPTATRTFLGLPLGVGKTVDLGRTLSEEEWERLVVDLRETFDARGIVKSEGSLRSWRNGNLQVLLEPGDSGQRIRFRTVNGGAQSWMTGSFAMIGIASIMAIAGLLRGTLGDPGSTTSLIMTSAIGVGMFGVGAMRLPGWARTRLRQMDEISSRLLARISNN